MSNEVDPFVKTQRRFEVFMWAFGGVVAVGILSACYPIWAEGSSPTWLRVVVSILFVAAAALCLWVQSVLIESNRIWELRRRTWRINAHLVHDSTGICPLCGVEWPCPEVIRELELPNAYGARKAGTEWKP